MSAVWRPVAGEERIQALDVLRGFALLGIALMNVEWFNRPIGDLDAGLPAGMTGIDHWAGWFVHVFVRGKFWTLFSLLFGMGFAVMLGRAERAGRGFRTPYLRRMLALAAFGALHAILLWTGDILFSYAVGGLLLLLVWNGRPSHLLRLGGAALLAAAACGIANALGLPWPWQLPLTLGAALLLLGAVAEALRRWPVSGLRAAGLALYLVPALAMAIGGAAMLGQPPQAERDRTELAAATTAQAREAISEAVRKRNEQRRTHERDIADEARVMQGDSYRDATVWRAGMFVRHVPQNVAFGGIALGMFLLGAWFVRSGVMSRPADHLRLFRRLAWVGIPLGLGLSLVAAGIATTHVRGRNDEAFLLASALQLIGSLPACLGYMGAVVVLLHGRWRAALAGLAPVGRMALTQYILQSLLGVLVFYGYGLGAWGMPRGQQVLYVVAVFAVQVLLSHWWLARFRFGPLEWLWRWLTYGIRPPMRRARAAP